MLNESSAFLWHKRLASYTKERLVKNEILPNLYFTNFVLFVDCIKEKQTRHNKKDATRSNQLLEIIHTYISGPFDTPSLGGGNVFITLNSDFSRYGFVYLLKEKSEAIYAIKDYITRFER